MNWWILLLSVLLVLAIVVIILMAFGVIDMSSPAPPVTCPKTSSSPPPQSCAEVTIGGQACRSPSTCNSVTCSEPDYYSAIRYDELKKDRVLKTDNAAVAELCRSKNYVDEKSEDVKKRLCLTCPYKRRIELREGESILAGESLWSSTTPGETGWALTVNYDGGFGVTWFDKYQGYNPKQQNSNMANKTNSAYPLYAPFQNCDIRCGYSLDKYAGIYRGWRYLDESFIYIELTNGTLTAHFANTTGKKPAELLPKYSGTIKSLKISSTDGRFIVNDVPIPNGTVITKDIGDANNPQIWWS